MLVLGILLSLPSARLSSTTESGYTVIASFTLAIAAGASPIEAAILSNHAAGIVVGKVGTAITTPEELISSFTK